MANPRDTVSLQGIGTRRVTYLGHSSLAYDKDAEFGTEHVDRAVKLSASKTVALAGADEPIIGAVHHVEPDGKVTVTVEGYIKFLGTGEVGEPVIGATGGAVKNAPPPEEATDIPVQGFGVVHETGSGYVVVKV